MENSIRSNTTNTYAVILVHVLLWSMIVVAPYFFIDRERLFRWDLFIRSTPDTLGLLLVFYINYFLLIKQFLFKGRTKEFIFYNLLLIVAAAVLMHFGNDLLRLISPEHMPRRGGRKFRPSPWLFVIRNLTTLVTMMGLSVALKMTFRWFEVESERKELEKAKSEAELQNMKNQISPHFLLNTLNNIYALVVFNPSKAQQAVLDLSKLLRHILYDNDKPLVPLHQEVDFIKNYIDLMRIRLSENVKLNTQLSIKTNSDTPIAPLIFISLIENAFKHGISGDKPSFIDISLSETPDGKIEFVSRNSFYPKSEADKSGSGIGLGLVKKRLEMAYPGRYQWDFKVTGDTYSTILIINTKED
ncbi:MAG: sensor histidine kinase [Petrimonas sp.]|jgi:signal transduction histidine kinase|uniref:sensor histidine kinase n=1 Tax=Petrimonas sp. TaxID=2023866 RepID=UPI002B3C26EC|nr:sensor histidine kinase [Petrimonas sp.]MEA5043538.1 sensor histidine kinase [Petrimonas sp.]HMM17780.1 sensor histidine kinase [Petrimonas sp.]